MKFVKKILKLSLMSFSLLIVCLISTNTTYKNIYAQPFEFNAEDYYSTGSEPTNSQANPQNSEDSDKENCINNQVDSVLQQTSPDSDTYLNNFHFIKKFDREGNLVDSWGTVGSADGQFLHAHGITVDLQDNVYVSDGENCNITKINKTDLFINNIVILNIL